MHPRLTSAGTAPICTADANFTQCEIGRFELGQRSYSVALASQTPCGTSAAIVSRFEIDGLWLVVLEHDPQGKSRSDEALSELSARLTGREMEIAVLVAQGHANKIIAHRLRISEWTVATYLRRIFAKLNVDSRAAMVFRCASMISACLQPPGHESPATGAHLVIGPRGVMGVASQTSLSASVPVPPAPIV